MDNHQLLALALRTGASLALEVELPPTERRADFDPCSSCAMPCRKSCPQAAFASNRYDRPKCAIQMRLDESAPLKSADANGYSVSYCRRCELACPVGQTETAETKQPTEWH